jgi:hypothetical protein
VRWEHRDHEQLCERPGVAHIAEGEPGEKRGAAKRGTRFGVPRNGAGLWSPSGEEAL